MASEQQQIRPVAAATTTTATQQTNNSTNKSTNNNPPIQLRYAATGGITLPMGTIVALPPPPPPAHPHPHNGAPPIVTHTLPPPLPVMTTVQQQQQQLHQIVTTMIPTPVEEETWKCHKCKRENLGSKVRCSSCQSWRGGKREGYGKGTGAITPAEQQYMLTLQNPWTCPCGNANNPKKVRCSKCQKWRGGRMMHKGTIAAKWYARQMAELSSSTDSTPQEPWTCDRCGNSNAPIKVRCMACPRWKDGKRPKYKKKGSENNNSGVLPLMSPMMMVAGDGADAGRGPPPHRTDIQLDEMARGANWFCAGCNHFNDAKKQRCGSCQRWKFGKRENMLKKNRRAPAPTSTTNQTPTQYQLTGVDNIHVANGATPGFPLPEDLPEDFPGDLTSLELATVVTLQHQNNSWICSCGQSNTSKSRCFSCQRWKGGKRGNMTRKSPIIHARPIADTEVTAGNTGSGPGPKMICQPNMSWKCAKCGSDNGCRKLRCSTCQSWKNGKKQLSQRAEAAAQSAPATSAPANQRQSQQLFQAPPPADDCTLYTQQWECHGCKAMVPRTKHRCSSCKSWKGGVRHNIGNRASKLVPQPWTCNGCKKENPGQKVRCSSCQGWRGGQRPDVALRKLEDQILKGNWICERCQKPNKVSKVRCGGCQRWRGGQRPDMRKSAKAVPNTSHLAVQVPRFPTIQMAHQMKMVAPPVAQPVAQNQVATNAGIAPAQDQILIESSRHPALSQAATAQAPATNVAEIGPWTCEKCTCDMLAQEMKCKICDTARGEGANGIKMVY